MNTGEVFNMKSGEVHRMIGKVLWQSGKPAAGGSEYRQALAFDQERVNNHPGVPELHVRVAVSHEALGWFDISDGQAGRGGGRVPPGPGGSSEDR